MALIPGSVPNVRGDAVSAAPPLWTAAVLTEPQPPAPRLLLPPEL
jgi:hypothetical protein